MTTILTPNADVVLGAAATLIYAAAIGTQFIVLKATVTNTDSAAHTVTCYRVPNGGTAGVTNILGADAISVAPGATVVLPIGAQSFNNGQSFRALADTGAVVNLSVTLAQIS